LEAGVGRALHKTASGEKERNMITIGEVSPEVKSRVVALFDRDVLLGVVDPHTIRTIVTGLALQTLNQKYNGAFGNGITRNASDYLTNEQALELVVERGKNLKGYVTLARDIFIEATINDVTSTFGAEAGEAAAKVFSTGTSSPDATGNDLDIVEAAADGACPNCGEIHN
jgi:hypothetical protein